MMGLSFPQIAIVVLLIVLLFGRGKISDLMGDVAKGIKSFKKGMKDDEVIAEDGKIIDHEKVDASTVRTEKASSNTQSS